MNAKKIKKLALKLGIQTYQTLTNDDKVCIPSISSILLAVMKISSIFGSFSFHIFMNKNKAKYVTVFALKSYESEKIANYAF